MRSIALVAFLAMAIPAGSAARPLFGVGPLCRDSKGLAKPCPPGMTATRTTRTSARSSPDTMAAGPGADAPQAAGGAVEPPRQPRKRSLFGMGKLCTDSKGVARPCLS